MGRARVLVVDDSVVVRRLVAGVLGADPGLEVVGTAPNGRIAVAKVAQGAPDVVVLDVDMPEMDGLAALRRLRRDHPAVKVVMFSALTARGAAVTLDALALGAVDYVTKPSREQGREAALAAVRDRLVPLIHALCESPPPSSPPPPRAVLADEGGEAEVVAVAASTGGPEALRRLLAPLPASFPLPVLVVQHMPALFTRAFAQRLDGAVAVPVAEAQAGTALDGGGVWIAPGAYHLAVRARRLELLQTPAENSCRPAADVLFRSVAAAYGGRAVAVVLSGMGRDGLAGAEAIRRAGGRVLAQDRASCAVWGMPRHVVEAGLVHEVAAPERLGGALLELAEAVRG